MCASSREIYHVCSSSFDSSNWAERRCVAVQQGDARSAGVPQQQDLEQLRRWVCVSLCLYVCVSVSLYVCACDRASERVYVRVRPRIRLSAPPSSFFLW